MNLNIGIIAKDYITVQDIAASLTLGDIIGLYDANGNLLCKYIYDAWGSHKVVDSNGNKITDENHIGNINPFRYRGYYYDVEFKLYYLNSRYYDPNVRRFISPDDVSYLDPQSVGGLNLYAYCNNNPVMYVDPNGTSISLIVGLAVALLVGFGSSAISQGIQYGWDNINYAQATIDGLFGVASVALAATGIGLFASTGLGATLGFGQYVVDSAFHGEDLTLAGSLMSIGLGAVSGAISGAGAKNSSKIANGLSGRADQGIRALTTAASKYGINSVQVVWTRNLYQGAINLVTQQIVNQAFTIAVYKILVSIVVASTVNAIVNYYLV